MSTQRTSSQVIDPGFPVFLTAWDPSDLAGGSIDPLGFDRGYQFLADKILPGLTNVASWPRYFSILCAGTYLADVGSQAPLRVQVRRRMESVLRFERFWALANVLASERFPDEELPFSGIRGITYVMRKAASINNNASGGVSADYKLLSRQATYGAIGIYGSVAEGLRLWVRKTMGLTPDLGETLGAGFVEETRMPSSLIKAVREDGQASIKLLAEWGLRAHISGASLDVEKTCFSDALRHNSIRLRMIRILADHRYSHARETELERLHRLLPELRKDAVNQDLAEAVRAILAYERCYRLAALGFDRLLWLCRAAGGSIRLTDLTKDSVLKKICSLLPRANLDLAKTLDSARSENFRCDLNRLDDVRKFLGNAADKCESQRLLSEELLSRHRDVQRGKFDKGRRKMPWAELNAGEVQLTLARAGGSNRELTEPQEIAPHPYRLSTADAFIAATEGI